MSSVCSALPDPERFYLSDVIDLSLCLFQADLAIDYNSVKDHNRRLRAGVASSSAYLKNPPPEVVDFVIWSAQSGVGVELSTRVPRCECNTTSE